MQRWPPLEVGVNTITFTLKLKLQAMHSIEPPQPTEWLGPGDALRHRCRVLFDAAIRIPEDPRLQLLASDLHGRVLCNPVRQVQAQLLSRPLAALRDLVEPKGQRVVKAVAISWHAARLPTLKHQAAGLLFQDSSKRCWNLRGSHGDTRLLVSWHFCALTWGCRKKSSPRSVH